jgi:dipeptide/tripeptide permease
MMNGNKLFIKIRVFYNAFEFFRQKRLVELWNKKKLKKERMKEIRVFVLLEDFAVIFFLSFAQTFSNLFFFSKTELSNVPV